MSEINNKLYVESTFVRKSKVKLDKELSINQKFNILCQYFYGLEKNMLDNIKDYLFLVLYRKTAKQTSDFEKDTQILEKYINKLKTEYKNMDKYIKKQIEREYISTYEIDEIFDKVNYFIDFNEGLSEDIATYKSKYFEEFKISSFFIFQDKTCEELEELINNIDEELNKYKTIDEACDYYIYNSGNEINNLITELLKINQKGIYLDYHYFIKNDAIISFTYNEWLDLMAKIRYVFAKIKGKVELSKNFKNLYKIIELRFQILLINKEL